MNVKKMLAGLSLLTMFNVSASASPIEILSNGDFATGDLSGWTQSAPTAPIEWGVTLGDPIGAFDLESPDGSFFASPWMEGPNPLSTTLFQRVDLDTLNATLLGTFTFSAQAIYADDRITLGYELYDASLNLLTSEVVFTGLGGTSATNVGVSESYSFLPGTRYISFFARGFLVNGTYIDSGFDNASILVDVSPVSSVPEPNSLSLFVLGMISLFGLRRFRD